MKHTITQTPITAGFDAPSARNPWGCVRITCTCGFVDKTYNRAPDINSVIEQHARRPR